MRQRYRAAPKAAWNTTVIAIATGGVRPPVGGADVVIARLNLHVVRVGDEGPNPTFPRRQSNDHRPGQAHFSGGAPTRVCMNGWRLGLGLFFISIAASAVPSPPPRRKPWMKEKSGMSRCSRQTRGTVMTRRLCQISSPRTEIFVNVVGWWWKGQPEIERNYRGAFAFVFSRERTLSISRRARQVSVLGHCCYSCPRT